MPKRHHGSKPGCSLRTKITWALIVWIASAVGTFFFVVSNQKSDSSSPAAVATNEGEGGAAEAYLPGKGSTELKPLLRVTEESNAVVRKEPNRQLAPPPDATSTRQPAAPPDAIVEPVHGDQPTERGPTSSGMLPPGLTNHDQPFVGVGSNPPALATVDKTTPTSGVGVDVGGGGGGVGVMSEDYWALKDHGPAPASDDAALFGSTWPPPDPRTLARRRLLSTARPPGQGESNPQTEAGALKKASGTGLEPFPPRQPASLCKAKGLNGGPSDVNKQLIDKVRVAPENSDGKTVMCLIYTIEKNHATAASTVRDTWASRCDGFVVMSTAADAALPSAKVTHQGPEEYNNIWQKVRSIWKYVHRSYGEEFDWFFIGGDDLFVIPSNLRKYLHSLGNATQAPMFLGRRFQIPKGQLFNSGGAGYALNRAALNLLVSHLDDAKCYPNQRVFAEDVNVAHCLATQGVKPHDTRDHGQLPSPAAAAQGEQQVLLPVRERFHPFTPGQHLTWRPPKKKRADGQSQDWYENYNAPWGIGLGVECCSADSVSFHYVKSNLMPHLNALLYECRE